MTNTISTIQTPLELSQRLNSNSERRKNIADTLERMGLERGFRLERAALTRKLVRLEAEDRRLRQMSFEFFERDAGATGSLVFREEIAPSTTTNPFPNNKDQKQ